MQNMFLILLLVIRCRVDKITMGNILSLLKEAPLEYRIPCTRNIDVVIVQNVKTSSVLVAS